jgi:hypothetical protein
MNEPPPPDVPEPPDDSDDAPGLGGVWLGGPDPQTQAPRRPHRKARKPPPLPVVYTPGISAHLEDSEVPRLEKILFVMCRSDESLFLRLLDHERQHHPGLTRREHLQLAIDRCRRGSS